MSIRESLDKIKSSLPHSVTLIAVSKTHPSESLQEAYDAGQRDFGENKVQELKQKYESLPKDIRWHLIGHLQTNKVKVIAPFVNLIHSVDSYKLLNEINTQAKKCNRTIDCLLQLFIAQEETKFGFDFTEAEALILSSEFQQLKNVRIVGLMGMASNTEDQILIRNEFKKLKHFYNYLESQVGRSTNFDPQVLSMGMSSDYQIAIEEGSTMIRVGSSIFGQRDYNLK